MILYTATLTDDEVDAILHGHYPRALAERLQDSELGICDQSRSLLLSQAAGGCRAELETPAWSIVLWRLPRPVPVMNPPGTGKVNEWGGRGTLQHGGESHTITQTFCESAEEVLDEVLDFCMSFAGRTRRRE